jgi:DeoR/GlpR family transcriptional regulator of sugar metabolism
MENITVILRESVPQVIATIFSAICIGTAGFVYRKKIKKNTTDEREMKKIIMDPVSSQTIEKAEDFVKTVAAGIIKVVRPYQEVDPISIDDLYSLWCEDFGDKISKNEFKKHLEFILAQDKLPGIVRRGDKIFIEETHFSWKSTFAVDDKELMAHSAMKYIKSGDLIALDAGSTTLSIAQHIAEGIKTNMFTNITIVTNFFKAVDELLKVAMEMRMHDGDQRLKIYVIGGRVRLNTLAIVDDDAMGVDVFDDFNKVLKSFGGADIAFVGTSGMSMGEGFTVHHKSEVSTKKSILDHSKRKIVVADPSKFGLRQEHSFSDFDDNIEILTTKHGDRRILRDYEEFFKKNKPKIKLIYAE